MEKNMHSVSKLKQQFNLLKISNKTHCFLAEYDKHSSDDEILDKIALELSNTSDIILLNIKPDNKAVDLGKKTKVLCSEFGATFLIYNRADIALLTGADGILLTESGISIKNAREILGETSLIGINIKTALDLENTIQNNPDYIFTDNDTISTNIPTFSNSTSDKNHFTKIN
ncbi:thiamine phosphate synthase [bacterium]|nr:thiamine phosphate synthase [bacterium]